MFKQLYPNNAGMIHIYKLIDVIHHIKKQKDKSLLIALLDLEKVFNTFQYDSIIEVLERLDIHDTYFHKIKADYSKPRANINLTGDKLKSCPLKSGTR